MARLNIPVGTRFGKLVVRVCPIVRNRRTYVECLCDCGNVFTVRADVLRAKGTHSCGCYNKHRLRTHGRTGTAEYAIWTSMKARCQNPKNLAYPDYGGRGIAVCERWRKFENFLADMGQRPTPAHSLERIDNDGNYEPSNCRWATRKEQAVNTRGNRPITFRGRTLCMSQWDKLLGFSRATVHQRINKLGWSIEKTLTTPMSQQRK